MHARARDLSNVSAVSEFRNEIASIVLLVCYWYGSRNLRNFPGVGGSRARGTIIAGAVLVPVTGPDAAPGPPGGRARAAIGRENPPCIRVETPLKSAFIRSYIVKNFI